MKRIITQAVLGAVLGIFVSGDWQTVHAENTGVTVDERLETLDQKVKVLERKWELEQEAAAARSKDAAIVRAGKDGFFIRSADDSYQLKIGGYIHAETGPRRICLPIRRRDSRLSSVTRPAWSQTALSPATLPRRTTTSTLLGFSESMSHYRYPCRCRPT